MMRLGTIVIRGAFILIRSGVNSSDWAVRPEVDCRYVTGGALTPRRRLVRWLVSKLRYAPGFETPRSDHHDARCHCSRQSSRGGNSRFFGRSTNRPITRWRALPPVRLPFSALLQHWLQITPMACRQL